MSDATTPATDGILTPPTSRNLDENKVLEAMAAVQEAMQHPETSHKGRAQRRRVEEDLAEDTDLVYFGGHPHWAIEWAIFRHLEAGRIFEDGPYLVAKDALWKWRKAADGENAALIQSGFFTASDIASFFGRNAEATRKSLERWRSECDRGWIEDSNPTARKSKYLYSIQAVRHLFDA